VFIICSEGLEDVSSSQRELEQKSLYQNKIFVKINVVFYKMKKIFPFILAFAILNVVSSCVKNNDAPVWIRINEFTLLANSELSGKEGALSHNFNNATILVDGKLVGVFELPVTLPLLVGEGTHEILVTPTIERNGINATKEAYPFVSGYTISTNLSKTDTLVLNPTTSYTSNCIFWKEDFEDASIKIASIPLNSVVLDNQPGILKFGNYYGRISLNTSSPDWQGSTIGGDKGDFVAGLPKNGAEIYLEIDYMNTNGLSTDLLAFTQGVLVTNPDIRLNAQTENIKWKKIYIELKELVSYSSNADSFEIGLKATLESGMSSSYVYIDNIKIIHR
jgi:hypothetical protein